MPHGFTITLPMPELIRKASAFSFQNKMGPPMKGFGFGSVVPMDEQSTTRISLIGENPEATSAFTWFSTPINSIAFCSSSSEPPGAPTAMATVSTPAKAGVRVAGTVTSP